MKKLISVAAIAILVFPAFSYAQAVPSYTPGQRAELIASITAQLQVLIKMYYAALQSELNARIAEQNQAIAQQNVSIAQIQSNQITQSQQISSIANPPVQAYTAAENAARNNETVADETPAADAVPACISSPSLTLTANEFHPRNYMDVPASSTRLDRVGSILTPDGMFASTSTWKYYDWTAVYSNDTPNGCPLDTAALSKMNWAITSDISDPTDYSPTYNSQGTVDYQWIMEGDQPGKSVYQKAIFNYPYHYAYRQPMNLTLTVGSTTAYFHLSYQNN